jgi:uncharacterized protein YfaP (DUF2135 family)
MAVLGAAVSVLVVGASGVEAKKRPRPAPCGGRFMVDGDRLVGTGAVPADAVIVAGRMVSTDSGCMPVRGKVKRKKKFTLVNARWASCSGLQGAVALKAKIDTATCRTLSGKLKAKATKLKRSFTAHVQQAPAFTTGTFTPAALSATSVGPDGGTISVTDPSSPLFGLEIVVPPGATGETITFEISFADITGESGLPAGATSSSKMIRITTNGSAEWNQYRMFALPVRVTLPYTAPGSGEESVRFYVVNSDGSLDPAGLEGQDTATHRLTFFTSTFGDASEPTQLGLIRPRAVAQTTFGLYVAIGLVADVISTLAGDLNVDSGFLPSVNGWYVPNYGSYYKASRGGSCFGFVGSAKYYYQKRFSPGLYASYHDPDDTRTWVDDAIAIEFTSRVHNGMADIWNQYVTGEVNIQTPSSRAVALSFIGGLYVTGAPVLLYIQQAIPQEGGTTAYSGAHAISIYRAEVHAGAFTFHVYDPNFPGNDGRRITYVTGTGFASYLSGTDAASSSFTYNYIKHVGFHVGLTDAVLDAIKAAADQGFANDSVFPRIEITSITGGRTGEEATEGTTAQGEHKWSINDNSVRIRGTILGGLAQSECCVVNNARVFLSNKRFSTPVNNSAGGGDGSFEIVVPIGQGENDLVIIGAKANSFSHWAAFKRDVVESTASPSALSVTLSWGQGQSDVDLYVKEPDGPGTTGDTVYYSHRKGVSTTNPYLDFDNVSGFGPEHYIGLNGMTTLYTDASSAPNLYGDYTVKVHYYSDHDSDTETTQPISWNLSWRFLAFCPDPCADPESDGFWEEGSASGSLATASSGNCCNIDNSGGDWSAPIDISYPQPDPADWNIPDPPGVMLP